MWTHVVHPVDSRAKEEECVDADALDAVTGEVIGIQRLLFGLLEERESVGQHGRCQERLRVTPQLTHDGMASKQRTGRNRQSLRGSWFRAPPQLTRL